MDQENDSHHQDIYNTKFYNTFRRLVTTCVRYRKSVIMITLGLFIFSIVGFGKVQQQFFPDSTRLELMIDLRMTEGASYLATDLEVKKLENWLNNWNKQSNKVKNGGS